MCGPVERRAQVIDEPPSYVRKSAPRKDRGDEAGGEGALSGIFRANLPCDHTRLLHVGFFQLQPEQVGVRCVCERTINGTVDSAGGVVVAFTSAGNYAIDN